MLRVPPQPSCAGSAATEKRSVEEKAPSVFSHLCGVRALVDSRNRIGSLVLARSPSGSESDPLHRPRTLKGIMLSLFSVSAAYTAPAMRPALAGRSAEPMMQLNKKVRQPRRPLGRRIEGDGREEGGLLMAPCVHCHARLACDTGARNAARLADAVPAPPHPFSAATDHLLRPGRRLRGP